LIRSVAPDCIHCQMETRMTIRLFIYHNHGTNHKSAHPKRNTILPFAPEDDEKKSLYRLVLGTCSCRFLAGRFRSVAGGASSSLRRYDIVGHTAAFEMGRKTIRCAVARTELCVVIGGTRQPPSTKAVVQDVAQLVG
jgi:hypothetical protein